MEPQLSEEPLPHAAARVPPQRTAGHTGAAEAALTQDYRRLVALAYLTLPPGRGRHARVLAAHAAVQRSLPSGLRSLPTGLRTRLPAALRARLPDRLPTRLRHPGPAARPARAPERPPAEELRLRVLRAALSPGRPLLPRAVGMRLFPPTPDLQEAVLDRAVRDLAPPVRAAWALRALWGPAPAELTALLREAGAARPEDAVSAAADVAAPPPGAWRGAGLPAAFDACHVQVGPTDLLRRRRVRTAAAAAGLLTALAVAATLLPVPGPPPGPARSTPAAGPTPDPAALGTVGPDAWRRTARIDFSAWPARGDLRTDRALLARALTAWQQAGPAPADAEPGTPAGPPDGTPRLLFAGRVDGTAVVLLADSARIARWIDGNGPDHGLRLARADSSDVTTAAAVALRRTGGTARYLLAPWIDTAQTRPLERPDDPARPLALTDGVTAGVPTGGRPGCPAGMLLQLRSSPVIAEQHAFLLGDVGGLVPAHLTWTPAPEQGAARPPREAVGPDALRAWAAAGCTAPDGSPGVRALNLWEFAVQPLPADGGRAVWMCLRADRWAGDGTAATAVLLPGQPSARRTATASGRACSRFEQDTVGWTWWRSPKGEEFLLAAGSRRVTRIEAHGTGWQAGDRTLAVRRPAADDQVTLEARTENGTRLRPLG